MLIHFRIKPYKDLTKQIAHNWNAQQASINENCIHLLWYLGEVGGGGNNSFAFSLHVSWKIYSYKIRPEVFV